MEGPLFVGDSVKGLINHECHKKPIYIHTNVEVYCTFVCYIFPVFLFI